MDNLVTKQDDNTELVNHHSENAQVANEQVQQTTGVTEQAATVQTEEPMIPKSRFDEINNRMKQAESNSELLKQQLEILARQNQQIQPPTKQSVREQVIKKLGLENEVYLTVQQQIAVDNEVDMIRNQQMQHTSFIGSQADYQEIVGTINPYTGQLIPSPYLQQAIKNNPYLTGLDSLAAQNPAFSMLAYTVSKQAKMLNELQNASQVSQQTLQAVQNQQNIINRVSPMSSSAVGGSVTQQQDVGSMTDEQFQRYLQRVANGEFDK